MLYIIDKSILNISVTCTLVNYNENIIKVNLINFIVFFDACSWQEWMWSNFELNNPHLVSVWRNISQIYLQHNFTNNYMCGKIYSRFIWKLILHTSTCAEGLMYDLCIKNHQRLLFMFLCFIWPTMLITCILFLPSDVMADIDDIMG